MIHVLLLHALMLIAACAAKGAISNVSFAIKARNGALLETHSQGDNSQVKSIDLQGSTTLDLAFIADGPASQASVIIQPAGEKKDDKNVVVFATPTTGGKLTATFGWDTWRDQFGDIEQGTEFDVSVAVWGVDPSASRRTEVAVLTFIRGPAAASTPGKVPMFARVMESVASMSIKPEISHLFRPEEKMVAAPLSYACGLAVFAPMMAAIWLMANSGVNFSNISSTTTSGKLLETLFFAGIAGVVGIEVAFWLGVFNLVEVLPLLVAIEVCTILLGIKLANARRNGGKKLKTN